MPHFVRDMNTYHLLDVSAVNLHTALPVGTYAIRQDSRGQFFLSIADDLTVPERRYGTNDKDAARILRTFNLREASTGVLLAGEKGSGKSLLARTVAVFAAVQGIPTLLVSSPFGGDGFNTFLQRIEQPCVVLFDEFEKVYDTNESQNALLTLFDGMRTTRKLFLLTSNDRYGISYHMQNRPGRLFYAREFHGVNAAFVEEYCQENLEAQEHIPAILRLLAFFPRFNFDMLQALVEEMNRYQETPQEALAFLNIQPNNDDARRYAVVLVHQGQPIAHEDLDDKIWTGNPYTTDSIAIDFFPRGERRQMVRVRFSPTDLCEVRKDGVLIFHTQAGDHMVLTPIPTEAFNYTKHLEPRNGVAYVG